MYALMLLPIVPTGLYWWATWLDYQTRRTVAGSKLVDQ